MSKHLPPIPPANRSPKGTGGDSKLAPQGGSGGPVVDERNLAEQDRQGNIRQNTTNQGYQQDR
ncbi:MAG TPA: hypothetical protein VHB74_14405 [Devosia sp.]|nr:hypothetical protein [Devosia sp.]